MVGIDDCSTGSLELAIIAKLLTSASSSVEHDATLPLSTSARSMTSSTLPRRPAQETTCAWASRRYWSGRRELCTRWNRRGSITLDFCRRRPRQCYGDPLEHPQREDYWGNVNPIGPRSVYDEAKRFAEALTMAFHRYHGVNTRIVRIFNTYGPRLRAGDGRVISNFLTQALRGEDITVYGDGQQTRSFCYVSDLIDGILRLSQSDEHLPVNIGNPTEMTVLECARQVLAVTACRSEIRYEPLPQDDPSRRRPDISRASALLGWKPAIDLRTGLELSLGYFRAQVQREATANAN